MAFVKENLIIKCLQNLETNISETTWLELTITKEKWCLLFACRIRKQKKELFFSEISTVKGSSK